MSARRPVPIAVLGDGGWGTTLAIHLHRIGHRVTWWGAFPDYVKTVERRRENIKFLPGVPIPRGLHLSSSLVETTASAHVIVLVSPSQHMRSVVQQLRRLKLTHRIFVTAAKGLERSSLKRMSTIVHDGLGAVTLAVLSGPNIARDIANGQPASAVIASHSASRATELQRLFMSSHFRFYTSTDVAGVELGGALKNPIAIAAGISDGLGLGSNAKAALVTRGVVEMARLGVAMGAKEETFWGLSGLGDLVTTCLAGRNHWLGEQLGQGRTVKAILTSTPMVIEGVDTAKAAYALGRRHRVELPIIEQVHAILFRGRSPQRALRDLMSRTGKSE